LAKLCGWRGITVLFKQALLLLEADMSRHHPEIFGYMKVANICCDILLYFKNLFLM
jgi:hypothetical protein